MVKRFNKRVRKFRGSQHHGWGKQKGHKGSGIRGGVGKSGPKTRHKMLVILGRRKPIGKHGFIRPQKLEKRRKQINVSHVEAMLPRLIYEGKAEKKGKTYAVDLEELGYKKLLAQGEIKTPMEITVEEASEKAMKKVEEAGGKVIVKE
ncbi:MAG: uL15 family ribosomal protein [Candidatus Heimdallarchaeaceae archaeon]